MDVERLEGPMLVGLEINEETTSKIVNWFRYIVSEDGFKKTVIIYGMVHTSSEIKEVEGEKNPITSFESAIELVGVEKHLSVVYLMFRLSNKEIATQISQYKTRIGADINSLGFKFIPSPHKDDCVNIFLTSYTKESDAESAANQINACIESCGGFGDVQYHILSKEFSQF